MAGLKIMIALVMVAITVVFFFPMLNNLVSPFGQNAGIGLVVWMILFAIAVVAVNAALEGRKSAKG